MQTTRPLNYIIHEAVLVVSTRFNIKWVAAFPVDVIHGIRQCLFNFNDVQWLPDTIHRIQNAERTESPFPSLHCQFRGHWCIHFGWGWTPIACGTLRVMKDTEDLEKPKECTVLHGRSLSDKIIEYYCSLPFHLVCACLYPSSPCKVAVWSNNATFLKPLMTPSGFWERKSNVPMS